MRRTFEKKRDPQIQVGEITHIQSKHFLIALFKHSFIITAKLFKLNFHPLEIVSR